MQHIKKLFDMQAAETQKRNAKENAGTLGEKGDAENKLKDSKDGDTKKKAEKGSYEFFKDMDMNQVHVDDSDVCSYFYTEDNATK